MKTKGGKKFVFVQSTYRRNRNGVYMWFRAHVRSTPALRKRVLERDGLSVVRVTEALVNAAHILYR